MCSLTEKSAAFAIAAHAAIGQKRKYTNTPYSLHPLAVCLQVQQWVVSGRYELLDVDLDVAGATAMLHDVPEDTQVEHHLLLEIFGKTVADNALALKDDPPVVGGPNRAARKAITKQRLANANLTVQLVKLADLADNAVSIKEYDQPFYTVFRREAVALIEVLDKIPAELRDEVLAQL